MDDPGRLRSRHAVPSAETMEGLLQRVAAGDAMVAEFYDRIAPQVYGLIRKVLRDPAQSEEVAQEVLREAMAVAP